MSSLPFGRSGAIWPAASAGVISFISIGFIDPGGRVGWRLGYALFTSVGLAVIIASATGGFPRQLHTHAPSARPGA